jgi:CheY-like chemotaxis protein
LRGKLEFETSVGVGTRALVTLAVAEPTQRSRHTDPPVSNVRPLQRLRILTIDDDPMILKALARVLRNHDVTAVTGGRDAIELLRAGQEYDIILCDVMMPDLTGMDVYHLVEQFDRKLIERIVFLTGGAFTESTREFLDNVPNTTLEKPLDVARINEILSARAG